MFLGFWISLYMSYKQINKLLLLLNYLKNAHLLK